MRAGPAGLYIGINEAACQSCVAATRTCVHVVYVHVKHTLLYQLQVPYVDVPAGALYAAFAASVTSVPAQTQSHNVRGYSRRLNKSNNPTDLLMGSYFSYL